MRSKLGISIFIPLVLLVASVWPVFSAAGAEAQVDEAVTISLAKGVTITVSSDPPGAKVEIGGNQVGKTPLEYLLPAGSHWVKINGENCLPFETEVEVKAGEEQKVEAKLSYTPEYIRHLKKKRMTDNIISVSTLGLAAAGTGLAVYFGIRSYHNYDNYKKAVSHEKINYYWDHAGYDRDNMYVSLGVAGAGLITAAIVWYLRPQIPIEIKESRIPGAEDSSVGSTFRTDNSRNPSPSRKGEGEGDNQNLSSIRPSGFQAFVFPAGLGMEFKF
ncbi:MAG: PEGA domain-containing protein [bacterium]|nr:PEGA domain-containing protein [bacterium]